MEYKKRTKITDDMSITDIVMVMGEGNPGAINIIMRMMNDLQSFGYIFLCDMLEIRGAKLYMLYNDCCNNTK